MKLPRILNVIFDFFTVLIGMVLFFLIFVIELVFGLIPYILSIGVIVFAFIVALNGYEDQDYSIVIHTLLIGLFMSTFLYFITYITWVRYFQILAYFAIYQKQKNKTARMFISLVRFFRFIYRPAHLILVKFKNSSYLIEIDKELLRAIDST